MKGLKTIIAVCLFLIAASTANSQILIALLLGDKLNSDKLEFGIDGGVDFLNISHVPNSKILPGWNLGFYFNFKVHPRLFIHTGVLVKSTMGTKNIDVYPINDTVVDTAFIGGTVTRKINYFHVPILLRWRFVDYFHLEFGPQIGLRYKASDIFTKEITDKDDLTLKHDNRNNYTRFDLGIVAGIGYQLRKGQGMTIGAKYYYGFIDTDKVTSGSQNTSAIYVSLSLPIGKEKPAKPTKEETALKKAVKKEAKEEKKAVKNK